MKRRSETNAKVIEEYFQAWQKSGLDLSKYMYNHSAPLSRRLMERKLEPD